jgi:hypothetical protein
VIANDGLPAIPLRRKASQVCALIRTAKSQSTGSRLSVPDCPDSPLTTAPDPHEPVTNGGFWAAQ